MSEAWKKAHPEEVLANARRYRKAHPERVAESRRRWREAHPEKKGEYELRVQKKKKAAARDFLGGKCSSCGATDDLHFHHIDPATKAGNVTSIASTRGLAAVLDEAAKCELLCGPCHRAHHSKEA